MKTFSEIITFADIPTGGGQIYSKDILQKSFDIYMSKNKDLRYGCMGSPQGGIIPYDKISHYLLDVWFEDNALKGKIEIATDKPMGKILEQLADGAPYELTLGLAAMATFHQQIPPIVSRKLFEVYKDDEQSSSKIVDDMAVMCVYVLAKSDTNH